jgi:phage-related baseplate assembly protein
VNSTRRVWIAFTFAGRANGIPTSGDVDAVVAAVDNINVRPVTAQVTVVAPTAVPIDITATGVEPLTVATEAAIRAELAAMFQDRLGVATPNRNYVLSRSWISEAIARAVGEDRHVLTVPSADVVLSTAGQMPVLGTVTLS